MDRSKLLLICNIQPRNYWNTVGKDKEYFPTSPRSKSIPELDDKNRIIEEPKDEWWTNSKKHNYCFWALVKDRSGLDGRMDPLLQSEIAEFFGCSSTKVHFMLQKALENFKNSPMLEALQELDSVSDEPEGELDQDFLTELEEEDEDPQDSEN